MEAQNFVTVYTVANAVEAEIIKNALLDEEVACTIEGENQAGESGLMGLEIKLQVPAEQAERARAFLVQHERERAARGDADDDTEEMPELPMSPEEGITKME